MPIFRAGEKLVYYAHVPKCAGSTVNWYLSERFGPIAFSDSQHTRQPAGQRWSRTSPQHIDRTSLGRLFPPGFFDATFTIVRHPVARVVSAYQFQLDVEESISRSTGFSDWLTDLEERLEEDAFVFDNHVRPMSDIVPEGAEVFYIEHGLDALVGWFDALTGEGGGPRAFPKINEQGAYTGNKGAKPVPSDTDLARIARIYGVDFERFGYTIDQPDPVHAAAPGLSPEQRAERDAYLRAFNAPLARVRRKIGARLKS